VECICKGVNILDHLHFKTLFVGLLLPVGAASFFHGCKHTDCMIVMSMV